MKRILRNTILFIYCVSCSFLALSQQASSNALATPTDGIYIPPLRVLIEAAIKHNAMLQYRTNQIGAKEVALKSEKIYWTRNFGLQGDGRYGNLNNNSINVSDNTQNLIATSTTQLNYSVGVYFKFPLFDALNRKNQLQQGQIEIIQARNLADAQKDELKQLVIKQYEDLVLKQKLLNIESRNLGNAKVNMEMVEKEFRSGVISIYEYVRLSDLTARIESDFESAKSEFLLSKKLMENLVGFSITNYQIN